VAASPGSPPIANAVTRSTASSVSFDATNVRAGTTLRQFQVRLPSGYVVTGGAGPSGWTVTGITNGARTITFRVANCAVGGLATGTTGTFRVDANAPTTTLASDTTDALTSVAGTDPCSGTSGWTETSPGLVRWPRKTLRITGAVAPAAGAVPLAATATWTVTNLSSGTRTVSVSPAVTPAAGWTGGACTPTSRSLAAGAAGTFTCSYSFTAAGLYTLAATATGTSSTSAVGAVAGTVLAGAATASFAFDTQVAGPNDTVRATLTVQNLGGSTIRVTPPTYAELGLTNLARDTGAADPSPANVQAGQSGQFVYAFTVTGAVGSSYVAQGTAQTDAGPTNLAVTPAGTVSASRVEWTPPAIVKTRTAAPYTFTVTVRNGSATSVSQVRVVNPQNALWNGMANVSASGLSYSGRSIGTSTTFLQYNGTLASGATATLRFSFTAVPTVTTTTSYPFQVLVYPTGGGTFFTTYSTPTAVAVPIPDVGQPSVRSDANGQVLAWVNTARTDAPHEGVVVFRAAAPAVPTVPADFVDYTLPANQPADFFYADGERSAVSTLADPAVGAFNYRICNYDALLVYSACNTGFWNGAGWLDSAVAPAGGWTHQLGGASLLIPGIAPGNRVGITTNAPSIAVLDLGTGDRTYDPVALTALPSNGSPAARVAGGRLLLFAADGGGAVTALDLGTGALAWRTTLAGEGFVAGPYVLPRQYAAAAFQAAYARDVAFVGSTTGRVLALDASTGAQLWSVSTGVAGGVRAKPLYDAGTNRLYVPTNGGGVLAYDLGTSSASAPPSLAAGWSNPGGTFRLACKVATATELVCADSAGLLLVLDKTTGAVTGSLATGATSPSAVARVGGAAPGYVVSNASRVVRVNATGTPATLSLAGQWAPGLTLSPSLSLTSEGAIFVGASDKRLHKLRLGDASDSGASVAITSQPASVLVGPPAVDAVNGLFVFGTEDGRAWAVPLF